MIDIVRPAAGHTEQDEGGKRPHYVIIEDGCRAQLARIDQIDSAQAFRCTHVAMKMLLVCTNNLQTYLVT